MKPARFILVLGILAGLGTGGSLPAQPQPPGHVYNDQGYRLPTEHHAFVFPRDHGSHPEFKIEWWYLTGHLRVAGQADPFGFQATFFRYALQPQDRGSSPSSFGTNQLYLAHMALVDTRTGRFLHEERLNRNGWDAAAAVGHLDLQNGNWSLRGGPDDTLALVGSIENHAAFTLSLTPRKPLVIFGRHGLSRKGREPSAASWYLTFPRLAVQGTLRLADTEHTVTGEAWMDHEISSSQLGSDQVGWDWASLRLADGREVMVYLLRTTAGPPDPNSTLAWVDRDGGLTHYGPARFTWTARRTWQSPVTGGRYPIDIDLATVDPATGKAITFRLRPLVDTQEMVGHLGGISYWEGACEVLDEQGRVVGEAYVELTGYAAEDLGAALQ